MDGFFDRHSVAHEFHCGSEWLAWAKGWRVGQKELHRQKRKCGEFDGGHIRTMAATQRMN